MTLGRLESRRLITCTIVGVRHFVSQNQISALLSVVLREELVLGVDLLPRRVEQNTIDLVRA